LVGMQQLLYLQNIRNYLILSNYLNISNYLIFSGSCIPTNESLFNYWHHIYQHWNKHDVCDVTQVNMMLVMLLWVHIRCGYTLRVTSQTSYSPEYITPTQTKKTGTNSSTGFVVSTTKTIQRLSNIFSAYFQRLFKDLWEQSAVEKLRV
jgi:hypothetical protein